VKESDYWIDITVALESKMPNWPGDSPVQVERIASLERGDGCNLTAISMTLHAGTHLDAPLHFVASGKSMDDAPLSLFMGPARVVEIRDPERITVEELQELRIGEEKRILFKTLNSSRCWQTSEFMTDYVHLAPEAAQWLVEKKIELVGIDYLSVARFGEEGGMTHKVLLEAEVWILEGLNLADVKPGQYELLCLPMKVRGAEGAPCRAMLRSA